MIKKLIIIATVFINACVSPHYCKDEDTAKDYGKLKCGAAVGADVVLAAGVVLVAIAGANSNNNSSIPDEPCDCPDDTDSAGNICGERSAWSQPGGRQPVCNGVVGK